MAFLPILVWYRTVAVLISLLIFIQQQIVHIAKWLFSGSRSTMRSHTMHMISVLCCWKANISNIVPLYKSENQRITRETYCNYQLLHKPTKISI